jgi:hypothetical protein
MLKVVHDDGESNATGASGSGSSLLDKIVRDGARQMLRCPGRQLGQVREAVALQYSASTPMPSTSAAGSVRCLAPRASSSQVRPRPDHARPGAFAKVSMRRQQAFA